MIIAAQVARWRECLLAWVEQQLPALTRLKQGESLPIVLHRRRLYVLPTGAGLFLGGLTMVMLLGALNYNNNPALLLAFLLASTIHTSLLQGYFGVRGLRLLSVTAAPVHAGARLQVRFLFEGGQRSRLGLCLRSENTVITFDVAAGSTAEVLLEIPASRRGWQELGRITLFTRHSLGLFRVWSWLHPHCKMLVFPAIESGGPPLPADGGEGAPRPGGRAIDETPHSLRAYRAGDPLRLIAWKRSAGRAQWLVREFENPTGQEVVLDWFALSALEYEARIRRLTRWLLDAERAGIPSLLLLPGQRIGPGRGPLHLSTVLRELALLPDA